MQEAQKHFQYHTHSSMTLLIISNDNNKRVMYTFFGCMENKSLTVARMVLEINNYN